MKSKQITLAAALFFVALAGVLISCANDDSVMKKKKGVYTVNTTALTADVNGFNGPTPLIITISKDTVRSIEALENQETPKFFDRVKSAGLLNRWNGMAVKDVLNANVDVVSGCTFSSNAVIENVRRGVKYYTEHK